MIEGLGWLKSTHWNVGYPREVGRQFRTGVTAKCNPAPSQHGGEIAVLKQHVRPGRPDPLLANYRIIIGCRKENSTRNSTRNVLDTQKGDIAELEALCPQQGLYIFGFREDGNHLHCLIESFLAASNKNLFQCGSFGSCGHIFSCPGLFTPARMVRRQVLVNRLHLRASGSDR